VGPIAGLDAVAKRKLPLPGIEPRSPCPYISNYIYYYYYYCC